MIAARPYHPDVRSHGGSQESVNDMTRTIILAAALSVAATSASAQWGQQWPQNTPQPIYGTTTDGYDVRVYDPNSLSAFMAHGQRRLNEQMKQLNEQMQWHNEQRHNNRAPAVNFTPPILGDFLGIGR